MTMTQIEKLRYIRDHLSDEDVLCQIAEEAAELAQAALKLRRAMTGTNPTPMSKGDALWKLCAEMADVKLSYDALAVTNSNLPDKHVSTIYASKLDRWVERLENAANTNCEPVAPTDAPTAGGKTRQDEFLKMFPRASMTADGVIAFCPESMDSAFVCPIKERDSYAPECGECRKEYWLAPAKEDKSCKQN